MIQINKKTASVKAYLRKIGFDKAEKVNIIRNRNLLVTFKSERNKFILKQKGLDNTIFQGISLQNEMAFLENIKDDKKLKKNALFPKIYHIDRKNEIFIARNYEGYKVISSIEPNENLFRVLGKNIAEFHSIDIEKLQSKIPLIESSEVFSHFNYFSPEVISNGGENTHYFIKCIQKYPDLLSNIDDLQKTYNCNAFIHGDLKLDNVLAYNSKTGYSIKLIDFEFSSIGDKYYDLGYVLGSLLMKWILKMDLKNGSIDLNKEYFDRIKTAYRAFVKEYEKVIEEKLNYSLIIKYAGYYLFKLFFNFSMNNSKMNKNQIMLIQIARNYLVFTDKEIKLFFYD